MSETTTQRPRRRGRSRVWIGLVLLVVGLAGLLFGSTIPLLLAVGGVAGAAGLILLLWRVGRGPARAADPDDPRQTWDALSSGIDPTEPGGGEDPAENAD